MFKIIKDYGTMFLFIGGKMKKIETTKLRKLIFNLRDSSKTFERYVDKLMRIFINYDLTQDQCELLERAKSWY